MNAVTLRRLLVFGVCAVGVGCLYLVPGIARAPQQVGTPRPVDRPTAVRSSAGTEDASTRRTPRPSASATSGADATDAPAEPEAPAGSPTRAPARPSTTGATAFDPDERTDAVAPAAVTDISSAAVTSRELTLSWPAASDNVAVIGYRVMLNGYEVATTKETHATVPWFNDDAREHVVQVRALDAAGNESVSSPNLVVARPTPAPSPSPTPTPPTPDPEQTPEPVPTPSATPSPTPVPSSEPSGAGGEPSLATTPEATASTGTR